MVTGRKKLAHGIMTVFIVFGVPSGASAYYKEKLADIGTGGTLATTPLQESAATPVTPGEAGTRQTDPDQRDPITSSGRAVPLGIAVHLIVPFQWTVTISKDIAHKEVSWEAHQDWFAVLNDITGKAGGTVRLDRNAQTVTLTTAAPAPPMLRQEAGENPALSDSLQNAQILSTKEALSVQQPPVPLADVSRSISPGSLSSQLTGWCAVAGYQLVWKVNHDLNMTSHAVFQGTFSQALADVFTGLAKAGHPLRVTIHEGNRVVEVVEE